MTTAHVHDQVTDPLQVLDIIAQACERLRGDLGVTITFADLAPATIADWTSINRTLTVRRSATMHEQYHCFSGLIRLLVLGPSFALGAIPAAPRLRLVHSPDATLN